MKTFIRILFFLAVATFCLVAARTACYDHGNRLHPGVYTINCTRVECFRNGTIHQDKCVTIFIKCAPGTVGVQVKQNNHKPFPQCCPHPECRNQTTQSRNPW